MRLCDRDIETYLDEERIVIEPRPEQSKISGVSVDVTLGHEFRVFEAHNAPFIDLSGPKEQVAEQLEKVMSRDEFGPSIY